MGRADVVVVGAGILGLAVAAEVLRRQPGARIEVLEKEPRVALHQTSHNTGVIHVGVYYTPGSLKARMCVAGNRLMYAYCAARGIPFERRGKLIVATRPDELARLDALLERGIANGVPGIERLDAAGLAELEPSVSGLAAVHTPSTGVVSFRRVAEALAADVRDAGGRLRLGTEALGFARRRGGVVGETTGGDVPARMVITCCGLHSDRVARRCGAPDSPRILPFRGSYAALRPQAAARLSRAIYPVPNPRLPMFPGVHVTPQIGGGAWVGPTAVPALSREGYRLRDVRAGDLWESLTYRGFRRLMRSHWRAAVAEVGLEVRPALLARHLRPMLPWMTPADIEPGAANGVRAQALARTGPWSRTSGSIGRRR